MKKSLTEIFEIIKEKKKILILSHYNPDGDAVGSMMGLKYTLESLNIEVDAVIGNKLSLIDKIPDKDAINYDTNKEYDLTIMVDLNSKKRLGSIDYLYDKSKELIILDHHIVEDNLNVINYIDNTASSATMVVYDFIIQNKIKLNDKIAYYLYLGLLTDTGGFVHNNTTSRALKMGSHLLEYNINHNEIYFDYVQPDYDINFLELNKEAINNLEIIDNKIATTYISYEMLTKYPYDNAKQLVSLGRYLKDIEVSLIFTEEEKDKYKVSLRSKKYIDVSSIAKKFNGGGHKFASGIDFIGNFEETKKEIIKEIQKELIY